MDPELQRIRRERYLAHKRDEDGAAKAKGEEGKDNAEVIAIDSDDEAEGRKPSAKSKPASYAALKPSPNVGGDGVAGFVPFHLLATTSARAMRGSDPAKKHFRTMRQLVGLDSGTSRRGQWLLIFNFLIDFSYLLEKLLPDVLSFHRVVVFYGEAGGTEHVMNQWRQLLAGSSNTVEFIRLVPSDPPRSRTNPLPIKIPYGVHHTKMFLAGYEEGSQSFIRVAIHTSNLLIGDCEYKTQGAYCQDFPLKKTCVVQSNRKPAAVVNPYKRKREEANAAEFGSGSLDEADDIPFEEDLITYLESYQYRTRQAWCKSPSALSSNPMSWLQLIRQYDYSKAYVVLIPSVPGRHKQDEYHNFGYLKLRKAIVESVCPHRQNAKQQSPPPVLCQFSSIGSLNEKWLNAFLKAIDYTSTQAHDPIASIPKGKGAKEKPPPLASRMKVIWPSMEEIRVSVEGYQGGGSVPGKVNNLSKEFLQPLFHRWSSRSNPLKTARHVPHIKTFVQPSSSNGNGIEWLVLTSHNLSIAAWGQLQKRSEQSRTEEKILFIRHWELGVFLSPATLAKMAPDEVSEVAITAYPDLTSGGGGGVINLADSEDDGEDEAPPTAVVPLPFDMNPVPYGKDDVPWATDRRRESPVPDAFGCIM
ncbi:hypothetical protein ACHAXT_000346 [Thalassiosira profunda]